MGLKGKLLCPFDTILTVPSLHLVFLRRGGEVGGGGGGAEGLQRKRDALSCPTLQTLCSLHCQVSVTPFPPPVKL